MGSPRLGIALGSGSARGWAHIGVLRALQHAGIEPDLVCGTSIGAFVGAAFTSGKLDELEDWVASLTRRDVLGFFDVGLGGGLIKGDRLLNFVAQRFLAGDFADLDRPFACVATDLANGREVWLKEGGLISAVRASIALPGLFAPHQIGGRFLVDGGLVNPVPVSLCRALDADVVVAVDLGMDTINLRLRKPGGEAGAQGWRHKVGRWLVRNGNGDGTPRPALTDVVTNSVAIMQGRISRSRMAGEPADVLVAPRLGQMGLLDYQRGVDAITAGRKATEHMLPLLHSLLE
ncbi:patatin-like phospholipase family protein [Dechloromonas sp. H13]|uniref:patatin-like phospholipase family protein n=1 Tax=Dechloromonas sp. H13 TaxID=2570193 RepID=UPI0012912E4E|nr:patatin-like phospholipase family protein [Dechloromonas sp. H13]